MIHFSAHLAHSGQARHRGRGYFGGAFFTYLSNQRSISYTSCSLDSIAVYQCGSCGSRTRRVVPPLPRMASKSLTDCIGVVPGLASSAPCIRRSGVFNLSATKNAETFRYTSVASQTERRSFWKPKGVSVLLYDPLVATPARNKSECATRFTVIKAPWLCPVTPIRLGSATPSRTASSTAAFASATS